MKIIIKNTVMGTLFAGGILIMGSDGGLFPWINFTGAGILGLATVLANREAARHRPARGGQ